MKYYLISILFVLVSCKGQKKTIIEDSAKGLLIQENSSMVLLLQDEYSEFDVAETMVIKDQKRLKSFYSKINQTRKPGFPIPKIDFIKDMIIVHCNGEQNKIGTSTLTLEDETDTTLQLVSKFESEKSPSDTAILTHPFCVYKMPLTGKRVIVLKGVK